ncbi:hypothetical protein IV203_031001 [Nitzschia inconspicua]|uniref:Uncharacterized protein n=1 Tax=Nitzschia inconspicua TaxID=303405 RepID=A0A9K3LTI7_9STRA|nr:hypothetical protein IV203_031001 [Nitzschia inconspicua]
MLKQVKETLNQSMDEIAVQRTSRLNLLSFPQEDYFATEANQTNKGTISVPDVPGSSPWLDQRTVRSVPMTANEDDAVKHVKATPPGFPERNAKNHRKHNSGKEDSQISLGKYKHRRACNELCLSTIMDGSELESCPTVNLSAGNRQ